MRKPIVVLIADNHCKKENLDVIRSIYKQVADKCIELGVKRVIDLGDVFNDRSGQNLLCTLTVKNHYKNRYAKLGIRIDLIDGNHDRPNLDADDSYLDVWDETDFYKVHKNNSYVDIKNCRFHFIAYYKSPEIYLSYLLQAIENRNPDKLNFLCTHASINGVRNNDGTLVDSDLDTAFFRRFIKVFVGHYHDAQVIDDIVHYIGSTHQGNFGEDDNKGLTVLYDDGSTQHFKLNFPKYIKEYVKVSESKKLQKLLEHHSKQSGQDKIRFILQGSQSEIESIDIAKYVDAGIDIKTVNIEEDVLYDENSNNNEITVFDKRTVLQAWTEYSNKVDLTPLQKVKGIKLINTIKFKDVATG